MQSSCWTTALLVPGLLLAGTPGQASGQEADVEISLQAEPGTRISAERLGDFMARSIVIGAPVGKRSIGETEKNLVSIALRIELISREAGMITGFDSETVRLKPGHNYGASSWIPRPRALDDVLVAPLRPAEFVIFRIGQKTIAGTRTIPKGCGDTAYALMIIPRFSERRVEADESLALCFDGGR